jgi:hypothetical protein
MSKLTGMWITKFNDADDEASGYAEDGEIVAEIGTDFILVTKRNVVADGPPASSQLFKISDLANDNVRFFENEKALNAWHAFLEDAPVNMVPFEKK